MTGALNRSFITCAALALLLAVMMATPAGAATPPAAAPPTTVAAPAAVSPSRNLDPAYRLISAAVVHVMATTDSSSSSGVVVSEDGLVVTHSWLIKRNRQLVLFADGREMKAKVLLRDPATKLAVLQILPPTAAKESPGQDSPGAAKDSAAKEISAKDRPVKDSSAKDRSAKDNSAKDGATKTGSANDRSTKEPASQETATTIATRFTSAAFGSSLDLRSGAWVAAVAYPYGSDSNLRMMPSLTSGILSSRGKIGGVLDYDGEFLVTDAATNAGSEGGALIDYDGRLVGIICRPQHHSATNTALNLALPIEVVAEILKRAREKPDAPIEEDRTARPSQGFLGVRCITMNQHCQVVEVYPDTPAEKSGLMPGDDIVKIGDKVIRQRSELTTALRATKPGDAVTVTVTRPRSGKEVLMKFEITLGEFPEE